MKEFEELAKREGVSPQFLKEGIEKGTIVVPFNRKRRREVRLIGIGEGLRTKVNANIGSSPDLSSLDLELKKLKAAIEAGTDTVMDLSVSDNLDEIREAIIAESSVPVGTVPIYEAAVKSKNLKKSFVELSVKEIFNSIERHLKDGVDFITVHCGVTQRALQRLKESPRLTGIVSRGGSLLAEWMKFNNKENPLYEYYDELLDMAKEYGVTLSLGDGLRPGSLADATDSAQISELLIVGELIQRAREAGVQAMVEGPGHIPISEIEANVIMEKKVCNGAPFYVLGPIVTDIAAGYDHITSAIGGALAAFYGADFLCYVTASEHLGLPVVEEVREGVIATRIAAHAADVAKGIGEAKEWDYKLSKARGMLDWGEMLKMSIDPKRAREIYSRFPSKTKGVCTMCGEYCAIKKSK